MVSFTFSRARSQFLIFCMGAFFLFVAGCTDSRSGVNPGDQAPNVVGQDLDGKPHALFDVKGKIVLVNFWASWCGPCLTEMPALQKLYTTLKSEGLEIVGVAVDDTADTIREYRDKFALTFPIILDTNGDSRRGYGLKGLPESFVLSGDHKILTVNDPDDGSPLSRIIGPREWASPAALDRLRAVLKMQ